MHFRAFVSHLKIITALLTSQAKRAVFPRGLRRDKDGGDSEIDVDHAEVAILKADEGFVHSEKSALRGHSPYPTSLCIAGVQSVVCLQALSCANAVVVRKLLCGS